MHSVVVGLGKTGASCVRYLVKRGECVGATDSRRAPPGLAELGEVAASVDLRLGGFDQSLLEGESQVFMSTGVSLEEPIAKLARARGIEVLGDVGALAIGASLGTIAGIVRQELVLFVMGGVFVLETVSVVLQVASFKLTGKRIFRMAPIHHHFELKGWAEPKVIVRFWIISFVLVLAGLATLKIR